MQTLHTVNATQLKNRLGEVLKQAALGPVAIERHGVVVAYIVPAARKNVKDKRDAGGPVNSTRKPGNREWGRRKEERVADLCAQGDFRPSRWLRAGNARTLAGVAAMLASQKEFDRTRMLALAERLCPGMSTIEGFSRWLAGAPVQAARLLPMIKAGLPRQSCAVSEQPLA